MRPGICLIRFSLFESAAYDHAGFAYKRRGGTVRISPDVFIQCEAGRIDAGSAGLIEQPDSLLATHSRDFRSASAKPALGWIRANLCCNIGDVQKVQKSISVPVTHQGLFVQKQAKETSTRH
jgi:hypothetical protein